MSAAKDEHPDQALRPDRADVLAGQWPFSGRVFVLEGEEHVYHLIERIVAPLGLRVDESSPYVDPRLPDGARVNTQTS